MLVLADPKQYEQKERLYIDVRTKEGRILSVDEIKGLPYKAPAHQDEWQLRAANFERLKRYLLKHFKSSDTKILDVGCGNGWMTHRLHEAGYDVTGIDLNMEELQQAEQAFGTSPSLQWVYADVMTHDVQSKFDVIVFGASCQYFDDLEQLTKRLTDLLSVKGEIHLLDSVFYRRKDLAAATMRSRIYYTSLGFPEMAMYYHHHAIEDLKKTGYTKVYPKLFNKPSVLQWWKFIKP